MKTGRDDGTSPDDLQTHVYESPGCAVVIRLYSPKDEGELVFLCSLLDAAEICYFVQNDRFGSLGTFSQSILHPSKAILVDEEVAESAREIIEKYLEGQEEV